MNTESEGSKRNTTCSSRSELISNSKIKFTILKNFWVTLFPNKSFTKYFRKVFQGMLSNVKIFNNFVKAEFEKKNKIGVKEFREEKLGLWWHFFALIIILKILQNHLCKIDEKTYN